MTIVITTQDGKIYHPFTRNDAEVLRLYGAGNTSTWTVAQYRAFAYANRLAIIVW